MRVPAPPNPVKARAIAVKVKFPKPSILNTRIKEISNASRADEMKKSDIWYFFI